MFIEERERRMSSNYEIIRYKQGLNTRIVIHCVNQFKMHWHKELELLLVLKGEVQLIVNGNRQELKEDDLFLVNSGQVHSTSSHADNILVAIQINPEACDHTYPQIKNTFFEWPSDENRKEYQEMFTELRRCIALMVSEYRRNEKGYQIAVEGYLNTMLLLILRNVPQSIKSDTLRNSKELQRIQNIIEYVNRHYTEKITLEQMAKNEYMSASYLSHFFKARMGITFQEFLNYVRLNKAIALMNKSSDNIGNIALDCGFANVKSFNNAFREAYGTTPGEYRRISELNLKEEPERLAYMEFDSFQALSKLTNYIHKEERRSSMTVQGSKSTGIVIDTGLKGRRFNTWKRTAAVGRAYDCLRRDLQEQLRTARQELKIEILRFHGIFSDEMRIVTRDSKGGLVFYWNYADLVLDFLVGLHIRPMMDLTFMPTILGSREQTAFWYKGNITKPERMEEWKELIREFIIHCLNRYGADEVRNWYFEIWNEPDYMWSGTVKDYHDFYKATVLTLHSIDNRLRIAGPSILSPIGDKLTWITDFTQFINTEKLPLDVFTYHIYGEYDAAVKKLSIVPKLGDKEYFTGCIDHVGRLLQGLDTPVKEIMITEYNISAIHKNYLLDTMFAACHMLYNFLRNHNKVNGIVPWTLSDIFEEDPELEGPFHGGFGLVTLEGIRKPSWYAQLFLSYLGDEVLEQGEEYIVTRTGENIQILAFSYVFYDELYRAGDRSLVRFDSRYDAFSYKEEENYQFHINSLYGSYELREYVLDRAHGSAYDLYERMGCPAELSPEDVTYLLSMARPQITSKRISAEGSLTLDFSLPPHGIRMVLLKKLY